MEATTTVNTQCRGARSCVLENLQLEMTELRRQNIFNPFSKEDPVKKIW
jgi:hypothetical protein